MKMALVLSSADATIGGREKEKQESGLTSKAHVWNIKEVMNSTRIGNYKVS